jgi:hypothetical protein
MKLHKIRIWLIENHGLHIDVRPQFFYCNKPVNNGLTFSVECFEHGYQGFFDSYSEYTGDVEWLTTLPDNYDDALRVGINECLKRLGIKNKESFFREDISSSKYEELNKVIKKFQK